MLPKSKYKTFNIPYVFYLFMSDGAYWMRFRFLCNAGIAWTDRSKHKALFSERMGITKVLKAGHWVIKFLKPFRRKDLSTNK